MDERKAALAAELAERARRQAEFSASRMAILSQAQTDLADNRPAAVLAAAEKWKWSKDPDMEAFKAKAAELAQQLIAAGDSTVLAGHRYTEFPEFSALKRMEVQHLQQNGIRVTAAEYGDKWPYTIPEGVIQCHNYSTEEFERVHVTITYGDKTYAINGSAQSSNRYLDKTSIWRDNPEFPGSKIPENDLIKKGLALCN